MQKVYEAWKRGESGPVMCIDPTFLDEILGDGYLLCEATVEMINGGLVGEDCRQVAIPREWVTSASSPDDWVDTPAHWRPEAA